MALPSGRWITATSVLSIGALLGLTGALPATAAPLPAPTSTIVIEDDAEETTPDGSTPSPSTPSDTSTENATESTVSPSTDPTEGTAVPTPLPSEEATAPSAPAVAPVEEDDEEGGEVGSGLETEEGPWGDYGLTVTTSWSFADTNGNGLLDVGESYTYTYHVTNVTDLDLTNLTLNYIHPPLPADTAGPSVAAGATVDITRTEVLTQTEFDYTGFEINPGEGSVFGVSWIVRGITPSGKAVYSTVDEGHWYPVPAMKEGLGSAATVTSAAPKRAGDIITYSVLVTNTGNTTVDIPELASPANTTGGAPRSFNPDFDDNGVRPAASRTLTGSYTVTAADVARGSVSLTINATSQSHRNSWVLSPAQTLTVKLDPTNGGGLAETGSDLSSVVPGIAVLVLAAGVGLLGLQRRRSSVDAL